MARNLILLKREFTDHRWKKEKLVSRLQHNYLCDLLKPIVVRCLPAERVAVSGAEQNRDGGGRESDFSPPKSAIYVRIRACTSP